MSIVDTIKALFCKSSACKSSESETDEKVSSVTTPEPSPTSEPEPVSEIAPKRQSAPTPKVEPQLKPAVTALAVELNIPEDSTLQRHFISNLKCEIEAGMPPRPTDSTLKRHYDSAVQAELENKLGFII